MRLLRLTAALLILTAITVNAEINALSDFLWVPCYSSNDVYKVNVVTHQVEAIIRVGEGPSGVAVGPYAVYVTCRHSSRLYCISKSNDMVVDSIDLSPELAFGIGVALDPGNQIYVVGRADDYDYEMNQARLVKLSQDGTLLADMNLVRVQGDNCQPEWNQMGVIGIAIDAPEIMIPWQRSWDVNTGIIIADTSLTTLQNFSLYPRVHGYRGPGAAYDQEDRGWSSGDRVGLNYLIGHRLPSYWGYYQLGSWSDSGQIYGDVAADRFGFIWTGSALGILMRFDPVSCQTITYQLGSAIKGIAIDRYRFIWVALCPQNVLAKFDSEGNQIGNPVPVGSVPLGYGDMTGYEFGRRMTSVDDDVELPKASGLISAYPNPFNNSTQISYSISEPGRVNIAIYNILGQKIAILLDGVQEVGEHALIWNAADVSSGIYLAKLESENSGNNLKIMLIK
jgi:YVTN family beta-propeller protein